MDRVRHTDGCKESCLMIQIYSGTKQFLLWKEMDRQTFELLIIHLGCLLGCCPGIEAGCSSEEWHLAVSPNPLKMCVAWRIHV
jgi:hypothetical protein